MSMQLKNNVFYLDFFETIRLIRRNSMNDIKIKIHHFIYYFEIPRFKINLTSKFILIIF